MADQAECASLLESRFDYRNTFFHEAPRFDISQPPEEGGIFDFILAGDIFEHVAPPVERSLANACALLKPHGFLAMTVPYSLEATTREHFAELHEFGLLTVGRQLALVNRTRTGEWQVFEDLAFHGGHGSTLELRLFSEAALRKNLAAAGFERVEFAAAEYPPFGIAQLESWWLPVIAARQPFQLSRDGVTELARQHASLKEQNTYLKVDALERQKLAAELERLQGEFDDRTRWAMELDAQAARRAEELQRLQDEIEKLAAELKRLQSEFEDRTRWAMELDAETARQAEDLQRLRDEIEDRTQWAMEMDAEVQRRAAETARLYDELNRERSRLALWEASRWIHLGRALGLGPKL
jgi:Skp family chaperone for outer membrane proteins